MNNVNYPHSDEIGNNVNPYPTAPQKVIWSGLTYLTLYQPVGEIKNEQLQVGRYVASLLW